MLSTRKVIKPKCVMASNLNIIKNLIQKPNVHLVNGLNVDTKVLKMQPLYVYKDPKYNHETYTEFKTGVLASTSQTTLNTIKEHLNLTHDIKEIKFDDLQCYLQNINKPCSVIYNSYSDVNGRTSYFLYYDFL
jgi:hypothetical protein